MKYYLYVILIGSILGLSGCNNNSEETEVNEIFIDHYKSECYGLALSLCLKSRTNPENEWSLFYEVIEGFEYEWGYNYKLKVNVENIENPPQDASSKKYTLIEVLYKVQESSVTTFDLSVSRDSGLVTNISPGIYKLYGEKSFSCTIQECATIASLITQDLAILFEFTHTPDPTNPLLLSQIKCSSSRDSFRASCL